MTAIDVFVQHSPANWLSTNVPHLQCNIQSVCTPQHNRQLEANCTPWRCHCITSSAWINTGNGKGSSIHCGFGKSQKNAGAVPLTLEPKINRLRHTVKDYYCAKFQVILITAFHFIMLAYTPTYSHTDIHRDKVIAISAPPYYVADVDNDNKSTTGTDN